MLHDNIDINPVRVSVQKVIYYPFHWHLCIEIILVLKGKINLFRRVESRILEEGDIEIININEAHYIDQASEDNVVIILQIDLPFAKTYYPQIELYLFNCSLFPVCNKNKKYIESLKQIIYKLTLSLLENRDISNQKNLDMSVEVISYLVHNFDRLNQYLNKYDDSDIYIKRFLCIRKYLREGIHTKMGLKEIAEKEYLNQYYLSHEVKKRFGYNFSYSVNLVRVEYSTKLLLSTNMSVSKIAVECGYSALRYYYKHFKNFFYINPLEFRRKFQKDYQEFNSFIKNEKLDLAVAKSLIKHNLKKFKNPKGLEKNCKYMIIDSLESSCRLDKPWLEHLNIYRLADLNQSKVRELIKNMQSELGFHGVKLHLNMADSDLWKNLRGSLLFFREMSFSIQIILQNNNSSSKLQLTALRNVLEQISLEFGRKELQRYKFFYLGEKDELYWHAAEILQLYEAALLIAEKRETDTSQNMLYDTIYMAGWIIEDALQGKNEVDFLEIADDFPSIEPTLKKSEIFQGKKGLLTAQGLIKPAYYGYYLLSLLGDEKITSGEGCMVTRKGESIQILLYNEMSIQSMYGRVFGQKDFYDFFTHNKQNTKQVNINVINLKGKHRISRYKLYQNRSSVMDCWINMGSPSIFMPSDISLLNRACFPEVRFSFIDEESYINLEVELPSYGVELIQIQSIDT